MAQKSKDSESCWGILKKALDNVYKHEKISLDDYMNLYSTVYNHCKDSGSNSTTEMVGQGNATVAYSALERFLREFIGEQVEQLHAITGDDDRLRFYRTAWTRFQFSAKVTNNLFSYLNRHWVQRYNDFVMGKKRPDLRVLEIYPACLVMWKNLFFVQNKSQLNIVKSALAMMRRDREGESGLEESLIQAVVESLVEAGLEFRRPASNTSQSLVRINMTLTEAEEASEEELRELQTYVALFETPMLEETRAYYEGEVAVVKSEDCILNYMKKAEARRVEEKDRSRRYLLDSITDSKLQAVLDEVFIEQQLPMFQEEFRKLLEAERNADLHVMFRLFCRVNTVVSRLKEDFREFVIAKGREAYAKLDEEEQNDPRTYVDTGLKIHAKYREVVATSFLEEGAFLKQFDEACKAVINKNAVTESSKGLNKSPELLARFVDLTMRKGDENAERNIDQAMTFFIYIEDKDLFQKYYNKFLANRLLRDLSASDDIEASVISRLKAACGHEFVGGAMKKFSDINISKETSSQFRDKHAGSLGVDTEFQILSAGTWNTQAYTFNIPPVLEEVISSFTAYYFSIHQGRKLSWLLGESHGHVTSNCFHRKYTFATSTAQMVVLLRFNHADSFSFSELEAHLNMPVEVLRNVLVSLVKAELLRIPEGAQLEEAQFSVNEKGFKSKRVKVDLQKVQRQVAVKNGSAATAASKEQLDMQKMVDDDRKMVIQAAIVRIMKMRRRLHHNALIAEVVDQVQSRFQPRIPMIKKCFGILIERDYIKRAEDDIEVYEYIS